MTTAINRRTVKTMDVRRAQAVGIMEKLLADTEAKLDPEYPTSQEYERGHAAGLRQALTALEWAFSHEQDWMYQR